MVLINAVLAFLWAGLTAYAVFAGADFGGGIWDLLAGNPERGQAVRARIEHSIGPVWEANHVWLIFTLVVLWTGFSAAFAAVASTLYIPFTVAAFGIILRGSAFAFRKEADSLRLRRFFGAAFAASSVITPFAFGTIAGAVASGRVPAGVARGDVITSWLNPTSLVGGVVAVTVCAYLAAVYLCRDAERNGENELVGYFRRRATAMGVIGGLLGGLGAIVFNADAPALFTGLTHRALPLMVLSAIAGLLSLYLLRARRFGLARLTAPLAVGSTVWAWAVAQYPLILPPSLDASSAAAPPSVMGALFIALGIGTVLLIPALFLLYAIFQSDEGQRASASPPPQWRGHQK